MMDFITEVLVGIGIATVIVVAAVYLLGVFL